MLIALSSENEQLAGAIVYWRLTGGFNGSDFNERLDAAGLDAHHISLTTPRKALRRAMQEQIGGDVFFRAHHGLLLLVRQHDGDEREVEFDVKVEASLVGGGMPDFRFFDERGDEVENAELEAELKTRFWHHVDHLNSSDMSSWLISQVAECDAVSLRDTGGVYFVPRHGLSEWELRVSIVHDATSCTVHRIPSLHSDEAVQAVIDAMIDECAAFTAQLQADIECEDYGERALRFRVDRAKQMLAKLARYETLLGTKLDDIRNEILEQQANAVNAALAAGAEKEVG